MALHELNVFATAARSIDEAVSSVYVDEKATEDSVGLPSLKQPDLAAVEWMRLHGNAISTLEQKLFAPNLTFLDVSSNDIRILDGALLTNLPKLAVLDVSSNHISNVIHVSGLTTLTSLRLACNALESLDWLFGFHSSRHRLQRLDVCGNMIRDLMGTCHALSGCSHLFDIKLMRGDRLLTGGGDEDDALPNPVCAVPGYCDAVLAACPQLQLLDGISTKVKHRRSVSPPRHVMHAGLVSDLPSGSSPGGPVPAPPASQPPVAQQPVVIQRPDPELSVLRHEVAYMKEETQRIAFASRLSAEQLQVQLQTRAAEVASLQSGLKHAQAKLQDVTKAAQLAGNQMREALDKKSMENATLVAQLQQLRQQRDSERQASASDVNNLRQLLTEAAQLAQNRTDEATRLNAELLASNEAADRLRQHAVAQDVRLNELSATVARLHEDLAASKEALQVALAGKASAERQAASAADNGSSVQLRKDLEAKEYEALQATRQLAECSRKCDELQRCLEIATANERAATSRCLALEEDVRTLRQELTMVRSSERHAQQEVDHCRNQNRDLQGVVATLREETSATRQEHQREVSSLQHGYDELRAQLRNKDHEVASLRTELQASRAAESALLRDLERERAATQAREREHATSLANVREELALCRVELRSNIDHSQTLQGLQDEVKRLSADLLAKTMQIREAELDKQEAVRQMKAHKRELEVKLNFVAKAAEDELRKAIAAAKSETAQAEDRASVSRREADAAVMETNALRAQCHSLRNELQTKIDLVTRLEDELRAAKAAVVDAEVSKARLSEDCAKSVRLAEDLQRHAQAEIDKAVTLDKQLKEANKEIKVKSAMLEDQNDTIRKLKQSLSSLEEERVITEEGLREAVQDLQGESEGLTRDLEDAIAKRNRAQEEAQSLKAELGRISQEKSVLEAKLREANEACVAALATAKAKDADVLSQSEVVAQVRQQLSAKEAEVEKTSKALHEVTTNALRLQAFTESLQQELTRTRQQLAACEEQAAAQKEADAQRLATVNALFQQVQAQFASTFR